MTNLLKFQKTNRDSLILRSDINCQNKDNPKTWLAFLISYNNWIKKPKKSTEKRNFGLIRNFSNLKKQRKRLGSELKMMLKTEKNKTLS